MGVRDHFSEMCRRKKNRCLWTPNAKESLKERSRKYETEHSLLSEAKASNTNANADDKAALEAFYVTHPGIAACGLSVMDMHPNSCALYMERSPFSVL